MKQNINTLVKKKFKEVSILFLNNFFHVAKHYPIYYNNNIVAIKT